MDGAASLGKVVVFAGLGLGITMATGGIGGILAASASVASGPAAVSLTTLGTVITAGGGLAGGFFGNLVSGTCQEWVKRKRRAEDWTKNHHLQLLVIRAMSAVIFSVAQEQDPPSTKLQKLADKVQELDTLNLREPSWGRKFWWKLSGRGEPHLPDTEQLEQMLNNQGQGFRGVEPLTAEGWHQALTYLDPWVGNQYSSLIDSKKNLICGALVARFAPAFLDAAAHPDMRSQEAHRKLMSLMQLEILQVLRGLELKADLQDKPPGSMPTEDDGAHELAFQRRHSRFVGRTRELESLTRFLWSTEKTFRWMSVSGEMGIGKSRLMLEFALIAEKLGWQTIWYSPQANAQIDASGYNAWSNWIPSSPSLLIIDDALDYPGQTASCLKMLSDRSFGHDPKSFGHDPKVERPIRVVLLSREVFQARSTTVKKQALSRWQAIWDLLTVDQAIRAQNLMGEALALAGLNQKDGRNLLAGAKAGSEQISFIQDALGDLRGNPLLALAAYLTQPDGDRVLTIEKIGADLLDRQLQRWKQAGVTDEHCRIAFYATITEGIDWTTTPLPPGWAAPELEPALRAALTGGTTDRLAPLLPHFLGSSLLLYRLQGTACIGRDDYHKVKEEAFGLLADAKRKGLGGLATLRLATTFAAKCWESGITERLLAEGHLADEASRDQAMLALFSTPYQQEAIEWIKQELANREGETLLAWMSLPSADLREWIVGELKARYESDSSDPARQEPYAKGLVNLTENADLVECRHFVRDVLRPIYEAHRENPGVQEAYARGFVNLAWKAELVECRDIVKGVLRPIYEAHRENPGVQKAYADCLANLASRADLPECSRITSTDLWHLYNVHMENQGVQAGLARALARHTFLSNVEECRQVTNESLHKLYKSHTQNFGVQSAYGSGLANLSAKTDVHERWQVVVDKLVPLYVRHPTNLDLSVWCTMGLANLTSKSDLDSCRVVVFDLARPLYVAHSTQKEVQANYAACLYNLATNSALKACGEVIAKHMQPLYEDHIENKEVLQFYASAIVNYSKKTKLDERRRVVDLHLRPLYQRNPEVFLQYGEGLFNLTIASSLSVCADVVDSYLLPLYRDNASSLELQELYIQGLVNLMGKHDLEGCRSILSQRILPLYLENRRRPAVYRAYARALVVTSGRAGQAECRQMVTEELRKVYLANPDDGEVQEAYSRGLVNLAAGEPGASSLQIVMDELRPQYERHRDNVGVRDQYIKGLYLLAGKGDLTIAVVSMGELCLVPEWGEWMRAEAPNLCKFLTQSFGLSGHGMVEQIQARLALPDGQLPDETPPI